METDRTVARFGTAGVGAMLVTHLVWDPALTLVGVHPVAWVGAKLLVVGGAAAVVVRFDAHRDPATAWVPWVVALLGFVGPVGWLELLV